ncbi:MAG TPA: PIN domain-containing protein, partial [Planctomycetota bacterium]|nr:PIN domain-containing protein [Planctomycetota bacterium]
ISRSESLSFVKFVPVDNRIAVLSTRLPGFRSRDPADRIIVATARTLDEPIVTKDASLRACSLVRTIW